MNTLCWVCIVVSIIILTFYIVTFSYPKERFSSGTVQEEEITKIAFPIKSTIDISLTRIGDGLGRVMLINKNGSIPLLLSFDGMTMKILRFISDKWYEDAETSVPSSFSTIRLKRLSDYVEIQLDNQLSYTYNPKMPLNVVAIKYFNSFGRFFSNTAGLSIL